MARAVGSVSVTFLLCTCVRALAIERVGDRDSFLFMCLLSWKNTSKEDSHWFETACLERKKKLSPFLLLSFCLSFCFLSFLLLFPSRLCGMAQLPNLPATQRETRVESPATLLMPNSSHQLDGGVIRHAQDVCCSCSHAEYCARRT